MSFRIMIVRIFKSLFKFLFALLLIIAVILTAAFFYARHNFYDLPVLMYHNVSPPGEVEGLNVTPARFREQIEFISQRGYKVITPYEYDEYLEGGKKISSKNSVLITFDDGYENNYTYAYDILKEHGYPAVIFVVVNKIGREDYLTIEQMKEMREEGIIFASHTLNEKYVPSLGKEALKAEICGSKEKLERIIGGPVDFFAYCSGGYTSEAQKILNEADYLIAFSTNRGYDKSCKNNDPFAIRRIKITDKDNRFKLWAKLTGIYNIFHTVRDPF